VPLGYSRNGRIKQTKRENKKMTLIIRVIEKRSVQSRIIYGYSHFNRRQIKNIMWTEKRGM